MGLTFKDLITAGFAIIVMCFSYLMLTGYNFPLISNYRWAIVLLAFLGISMHSLSSNVPHPSNSWIMSSSILGIIVTTLVIIGIVTGSKVVFVSLTILILTLWASATLRHLMTDKIRKGGEI